MGQITQALAKAGSTAALPTTNPVSEPSEHDDTSDPLITFLSKGGRLSIAKLISVRNAGNIEILCESDSAETSAAFKELQQTKFDREVAVAYRDTAVWAEISEIEQRVDADGEKWHLTLRDSTPESHVFSEMAYNKLSSNEIAEMRARLILLGEKPEMRFGENVPTIDSINDAMLHSFVSGMSGPLKAQESSFSYLNCEMLNKYPKAYVVAARTLAVKFLILSHTVNEILKLDISIKSKNTISVKFRGRRAKIYSNLDAHIIEFEGLYTYP